MTGTFLVGRTPRGCPLGPPDALVGPLPQRCQPPKRRGQRDPGAGVILLAALIPFATAQCAEFRVSAYGAKGDGKTVDTVAIQKTIDAAAKAGNGTIVLNPGVYLTGSLFLKSGTHLRLDEGVEIHGVQDQAAYPILQTRVAGIEMKWPAALINVYQQDGVEISGKGSIDGDGKLWWDAYRALRADYEPKGLRWAADYDCQRPRLIQIYKSSNVNLSGLTLKRSGFWTVHICYSQKVTVDGVTIRNNIGGMGPSTDGIDVDSSADVLVEHCDIECNDDAICLKAGRDADGLRVNRPTERVVIRDNTVRGGAAGVTVGSETSGGIHDVEAYRLHVLGRVSNGILFKSASTRGGTVENINIHDVDIQGTGAAISITMNWNPAYSYAKLPEGVSNIPDYWHVLLTPVSAEKGLPHVRHVRIAGIKASGAQRAFSVSSYANSPLQDFTFQDLDIEARIAGSIENAEDWKFTRTSVRAADGSHIVVKDSRGVTGLEGQ
jgi:polygalacturonase